jgi:hypothetical protein
MRHRRHPRADERCARLLELLTECAREGRVAPSNAEMADHLGIEFSTTASKTLQRLEARGDVSIKRFKVERIITITATGDSTAAPLPRAQPLHADEAAPADDQPQSDAAPVARAHPQPLGIDREPCRLCGVRGDIGCRHTRRAARHFLFVPVAFQSPEIARG